MKPTRAPVIRSSTPSSMPMPARRIGHTATFFPEIRGTVVRSSGVSISTSSVASSFVASYVRRSVTSFTSWRNIWVGVCWSRRRPSLCCTSGWSTTVTRCVATVIGHPLAYDRVEGVWGNREVPPRDQRRGHVGETWFPPRERAEGERRSQAGLRVAAEARIERTALAEGGAAGAQGVEVAVAEGAGDDGADLAQVVLVEAPHRDGRRAEPDAGGLHRRALVEGHRVPVRGDPHLVEPLLRRLARPVAPAQVDLEEVRVRAAREEVVTGLEERVRERIGVRADLLLVGAEGLRRRDLEARRLRSDDVQERPALHPREDGLVDRLGVLLRAEDEPGARAGERLVRRRGDEVAVRHGVRVQPGGDKPGEVRHVAEEERADLVRDLAKAVGLDRARVGRGAADDQLRAVLLREAPHLVEVDEPGLAVDAVADDVVKLPGEVDLEAVRQVTAVVEAHGEDRVARLEAREVDGHVRLRAGVRLDVRVLGVEERRGAVDGELLDLVGHLAAAVVAPARIALGVLVRRDAPDRLQHGRPGEVLGGDQLDLPALALELAPDQRDDVRVDVGEPRAAQLLEGLHGDRHTPATLLREPGRASAVVGSWTGWTPWGSWSSRASCSCRSPASTRTSAARGASAARPHSALRGWSCRRAASGSPRRRPWRRGRMPSGESRWRRRCSSTRWPCARSARPSSPPGPPAGGSPGRWRPSSSLRPSPRTRSRKTSPSPNGWARRGTSWARPYRSASCSPGRTRSPWRSPARLPTRPASSCGSSPALAAPATDPATIPSTRRRCGACGTRPDGVSCRPSSSASGSSSPTGRRRRT